MLIPSGWQKQQDLTAIAAKIRQIQSDKQNISTLCALPSVVFISTIEQMNN